jgi:hypothetical protein
MPTVLRTPIAIDGETVEIGSAAELAVALDVLQGQYDREVLTQLKPRLPQIIPQAKDFLAVMKSLSSQDQVFLIEALGQDLPKILQDSQHLRDLLATLADVVVEEALITTLGTNGLHYLLLTIEELAEVLEWVYGQCDQLVLNLFGLDSIRRLCGNAAGLSDLLRSLDHGLQERLIEQLGWEFCLGLVCDSQDLTYLLRALPAASSERLLKHYTPSQLRDIIGNAHNWISLYHRLEPAEADYISNLLGLTGPERISHA